MIRILIADDHTVVRKGLTQIISEANGMAIADEANLLLEFGAYCGVREK